MSLRDILQDVYDRHRELTPELVVDEARSPEHPLHHRFEWDNKVAGEAYRRIQAAELIRSVKVVYATDPDGKEHSIRAFSAVRNTATPEKSTYMPTRDALADDFTRKLLLQTAEREWRSLHNKYGHLSEFAEMVKREIDGEVA